jgi:F-type H+-transporting ATPase subunit b
MDNPLVQLDPGLFIWTILTFLVLLGLLGRFAWGPLLQALETRQEGIRKSLEDAEAARRELERLNRESGAILKSARIEAESIVTKSRGDAEALREEFKKRARAEADAMIGDAKRQIASEKAQAIGDLRNQVAELAIMIATKVLERNVSREDNDKLVEDTLKRLETLS